MDEHERIETMLVEMATRMLEKERLGRLPNITPVHNPGNGPMYSKCSCGYRKRGANHNEGTHHKTHKSNTK